MPMLQVALDVSTTVVAIDPGKVSNRVWLSNGSGPLAGPVSMPVSRAGIAGLEQLVSGHLEHGVVIAIEATGSLHRAWSAELERRYPGAVRLFAPSETKAARTQLGSGRFKTDDRDVCRVDLSGSPRCRPPLECRGRCRGVTGRGASSAGLGA